MECIVLFKWDLFPATEPSIIGNSRQQLESAMRYQLYRNTTPGTTLQESLDEMIESNQMSAYSALQIMSHFDEVINENLGNQSNCALLIKGNLNSYRHLDNVWTFVVDDFSVKEGGNSVTANSVKIVACEGKLNSERNSRKRKIPGTKNIQTLNESYHDEVDSSDG